MLDLLSIGYDPDDDAPPARCEGPAYPGAAGCGRFLSVGAWMCERCRAESSAYYREDRIAEAQQAADHEARWAAFWASPEGRAAIEAEQVRLAELEDLPF